MQPYLHMVLRQHWIERIEKAWKQLPRTRRFRREPKFHHGTPLPRTLKRVKPPPSLLPR